MLQSIVYCILSTIKSTNYKGSIEHTSYFVWVFLKFKNIINMYQHKAVFEYISSEKWLEPFDENKQDKVSMHCYSI